MRPAALALLLGWALGGGIAAAACGDGVLEAGEGCDDGNAVAGDACDEDCHPAIARRDLLRLAYTLRARSGGASHRGGCRVVGRGNDVWVGWPSTATGTVERFDVRSGTYLGALALPGGNPPYFGDALASIGGDLVVGGDTWGSAAGAFLIAADSGALVRVVPGRVEDAVAVGGLLVLASGDGVRGVDPSSGTVVWEAPEPIAGQRLAVLGDLVGVTGSFASTVEVLDPGAGIRLRQLPDPAAGLVFGTDGPRIGAVGGDLLVSEGVHAAVLRYDAATGVLRARYDQPTLPGGMLSGHATGWGGHVVLESIDRVTALDDQEYEVVRSTQIRDAATGALVGLLDRGGSPIAIDERHLAFCDWDPDAGRFEVPVYAACSDDVLAPGEECDDGNLVDGDGCDRSCTQTRCGNALRTAGEECDDGNRVAGDGCEPDCTETPPWPPPGAACTDPPATCAARLAQVAARLDADPQPAPHVRRRWRARLERVLARCARRLARGAARGRVDPDCLEWLANRAAVLRAALPPTDA